MRGKIYTTGEFAKLCGTTKATLMLYDKKGIIKPDYIGENGYRYYTSDQFLIFSIISIFKKTGASLSEIKEIFDSHEPYELIKVLNEKRTAIAMRQVELAEMQKQVEYLLSSSESIHYGNGEVYLKYFPEEYYISVPTGCSSQPEKGIFYSEEKFVALGEYVNLKGYPSEKGTPYEIIDGENFINNVIYPSFYITKIPYKADDPRLFIKPAGIYAVANFFDEWDNIPKNVKLFKAELERRGYRYTGNMFNRDIVFTLLLNDKKSYGYTFSIKTE